MTIHDPGHARFCWLDLAARDADAAKSFYGALFGWTPRDEHANGGRFTRLVLEETDVASLYQLSPRHLTDGVPSHWTPYVATEDVERTAAHAASLGATVLVRPFDVAGIARICLIRDPGGALIGLWQRKE